MKIDFTRKEMEYMLFLINEYSVTDDEGNASREYTIDEMQLMDKLETALRLLDMKETGLAASIKNRQLN